MQIVKGSSAYILFKLCPELRKRYPKGNFWNKGYFCQGCGTDFDRALSYVQNQEIHLINRTLSALADRGCHRLCMLYFFVMEEASR